MKRRRITALILAGLAGLSWTSLSTPAAPAAELEPDCRVTVDNPHRSSGPNGLISKGRITCSSGYSITFTDVRVSLYTGCNDPLPATKPFTRFDCDDITTESYGTVQGKAGGTVTLYVPRPGSAHANVAGYHRAYIEWEYPGSQTVHKNSSQQVSGVR